MRDMLATLGERTREIRVLVADHHSARRVPGSLAQATWPEGQRRRTGVAAESARTHVVDAMIYAHILLRDDISWRVIPYSVDVAGRLVGLIARGAPDCRAPLAGSMTCQRVTVPLRRSARRANDPGI